MTINGLMELLMDINEGRNPKVEYYLSGELTDLISFAGNIDNLIAKLDVISKSDEYKSEGNVND